MAMAALLGRCQKSSSNRSSTRANCMRFYASRKGNEGLLYAEQRADLLKQWGVYQWAQDADYARTYGVAAALPPAGPLAVHAVLLARVGSLCALQLNRRAAGNPLAAAPQRLLAGALLRHGREPRVTTGVLVRAAQPGVLSVGNELAELLAWLRAGPPGRDRLAQHMREQRQLANLLPDLPLPCVAWLNGQLHGAGQLLLHASHVVATELTSARSPEVLAGWFPDAGRLHLLANAPHHAGFYAALTGRPLNGADLLQLGLAHFSAPAESAEMVEEALGSLPDPHIDAFNVALKAAHHAELPPASLGPETLHAIDAAFANADSLEAVLERLAKQDSAWSLSTAAALRRACPLTARLTFEMLRRAKVSSLPEALDLEERACVRLLTDRQGAELLEGLEALVEHQREPRWQHQRLEDVRAADVDALLRPVSTAETGPLFFSPFRNPLFEESRKAVNQMAEALSLVPRLHTTERILSRLDSVDDKAFMAPAAVEAIAYEDLLADLRALVREGIVVPNQQITAEEAMATYALEHGIDPWTGTEPALGMEWWDAMSGPHADAIERMLEYQADEEDGVGEWAERAQMKAEDPVPPTWDELPLALRDPLAELEQMNLTDPEIKFRQPNSWRPRPNSRLAHQEPNDPSLEYY